MGEASSRQGLDVASPPTFRQLPKQSQGQHRFHVAAGPHETPRKTLPRSGVDPFHHRVTETPRRPPDFFRTFHPQSNPARKKNSSDTILLPAPVSLCLCVSVVNAILGGEPIIPRLWPTPWPSPFLASFAMYFASLRQRVSTTPQRPSGHSPASAANLSRARLGCAPSAERDYPTFWFLVSLQPTLFSPGAADRGL